MFDYEVMTNEQAEKERFSLLNDGEYHATITAVVPKLAASGNNMFVVDMDVYDDNGRPNQVRDHLVFTPKMMWKIIHCCESADVLHQYENKKLTPHSLINRNVKVKIITQQGNAIPPDKLNGKPLGSTYPTKNAVDDYLARGDSAPKQPAVNELNDDLPF